MTGVISAPPEGYSLLDATVSTGDSRFLGQLYIETAGPRPKVTANLEATTLQLTDFRRKAFQLTILINVIILQFQTFFRWPRLGQIGAPVAATQIVTHTEAPQNHINRVYNHLHPPIYWGDAKSLIVAGDSKYLRR